MPRRAGDLFDLSDPEPAAAAASRRIAELVRAVDGEHWNRGRDVELEWSEAGWVLLAGDRSYQLDRFGRVHEIARGRLRVLDEAGVVCELEL